MKKIQYTFLFLLLVMLPALVFSADQKGKSPFGTGTGPTFPTTVYNTATACNNNSIQGLLICAISYLQKLIPLTASLALLYFLWGVFKIIRAQGDMKKMEEGKKTAFWGIIALFVLISIGGLVAFLQHDLLGGISNTLPPK